MRNCRCIVYCIFMMLFNPFVFSQTGEQFCKAYPKSCLEISKFYDNNFQLLDSIVNRKFGLPLKFVYAIVSPEVAMYNQMLNSMEMNTMHVFYVQLGNQYSNFSVGFYQMKISFALQIETLIENVEKLKKFRKILKYNDTIPQKIRMERLQRMNMINWQTIYLCAYYEIMQIRWAGKNFKTTEDKLRFYATAYNIGIEKSEKTIENWQYKPYFPKFNDGLTYCYSDICVYWFLHSPN